MFGAGQDLSLPRVNGLSVKCKDEEVAKACVMEVHVAVNSEDNVTRTASALELGIPNLGKKGEIETKNVCDVIRLWWE